MNPKIRYLFVGLGILATVVFLWYFSVIVSYIVIAAVLTLIGRPMFEMFGQIEYRGIRIPAAIRSLLTLVFLWVLVISFFRVFIPIIASEAGQLSNIDVEAFLDRMEKPVNTIERLYHELNISQDDMSFDDYLKLHLSSIFNISILSGVFGSLFSLMGDIFVAIFAISFISFFLLKEENLLTDMILAFVPQNKEADFRRALNSIKHLLSRYLIGILVQLTGILILVSVGMFIIGFTFKQGLLIGLIAAIVNIIPYLGPVIGTSLGILLGMAFNIHLGFHDLLVLGGYMLLVFIIVQVIDNTVFQPFIFSNSVYAHPLEIFLVIMMAGSMAGIPGMILAIPSYTIIRVFAKEFFSDYRIVKKLTRKI